MENYINVLSGYNLEQIVNQPTRVTHNSATLIDHIVTSNTELVSDLSVLSVDDVSDHCLISCSLNFLTKPKAPVFKTFRDFSHFDYDNFRDYLRAIPWKNIYDLTTADEMVSFLRDNIITVLDLCAPNKTVRISKPPAPWLTDTVKLMMKTRDGALSKYKRSGRGEDWSQYAMLRNMVTKACRREKRAYFLHSLQDRDSRKTWTCLKTLCAFGGGSRCLPTHLSDPDAVNNHFVNSIPKSMCNVQETVDSYSRDVPTGKRLLKFEQVDEATVLRIINSIKSKAVGSDGIGIDVIKLCIPYLLPYITHIVNFCIAYSVFPTEWKHAQVVPLPKIANPTTFKELRPISILSTLSKILERVITEQLQTYLNTNGIIPPNQSGFRQGFSCATALLDLTDTIISSIDEGQIGALVMLDYTKAFDTINHPILLSVLCHIGLGESAVRFFQNYLDGRTQAVVIEGKKSCSVKIEAGLPQGSIISPIMYTIYTCKFVDSIKLSKAHFYADDTQLLKTFHPSEARIACQQLNTDIQDLIRVSENHCLHINAAKSCLLLFGREVARERARDEIEIRVKGQILPISGEAKDLGLVLDSDLRFKRHVSSVLQRAYGALKVIYSNREYLDQRSKTLLCTAYVLSRADYADTVYGPCLDAFDKQRLQKLQNSCLRLIFGIRKYQSVRHCLGILGWLNMENRRRLHSVCLFHNVISFKTPPYLYNKISFRSDVHHLNLRRRSHITVPAHHTQFFKRCFKYSLSNWYNAIPTHIRALSATNFKQKYVKLLLESSQ